MRLFRNTILSILIFAFSAGILSVPRKAEAQWLVEEVGPALFFQATIAASTVNIAATEYSRELREYLLNTLATTLVKQLIRQFTGDIVNWINSGFEGSPAFVTNPAGTLLDLADQITGDFLARAGGPLADLCSPFSIDIRLALAFKYHPKIREKYACTLGTIIKNSKNAVEGASVNGQSIKGFMNGDFSQGGWPAFVSLTTEPQNNPYGAYLEANSELSIRVANAQLQKRDEISQGSGFLSWRNPSCKREVNAHNARISNQTEEEFYSGANRTEEEFYGGQSAKRRSVTDCPVETPGSLVAGSLQNRLDGPLREMELVDSINEIVNALAAQLVNTVLSGGLRAISGTSPSDTTSYISQVEAESRNMNTEQMQGLRGQFLGELDTAIENSASLRNTRKTSLNIVLQVRSTYESAKACYQNKASAGTYDATIRGIDAVVAPLNSFIQTLTLNSTEAESTHGLLTSIKAEVTGASDSIEFNRAVAKFTGLQTSRRLADDQKIREAEEQLNNVRIIYGPKQQDAQQLLSSCQG